MKNTILRLLERYVEFLVLAAVAVMFALYLTMQFVGDPNAGRNGVSPSEVNATLQQEAMALKRNLEQTGVAGLQDLTVPDPPDLLERYQVLAEASVVPDRFESFAVGPRGPVDTEGGDATAELAEVHVPTIPSPKQAFVYQSFDTVAASAVAEHESLAAQFDATPFDVSWLTIAAEFDIAEVLSRFRAEGTEEGRGLSERWFDGRVDVLDVVVERREVLADGTTTEPELIDLLPGQISFRERIEGEVSAGDRDDMLDDLRSDTSQQMVVQPEFLPTVAGRWEDPQEAKDTLDRGGEESPRERLIRLVDRRRKAEAELGGGGLGGGPGGGGGLGGGPGGGMGGGPGGGMGGGPGGGGGLGGGPGGGGGLGGGPGGGGGGSAQDKRIKRLEQQIRRLTNEINRLARTLGLTEEEVEAIEQEDAAEATPFELKGSLWIWAHDLEVEPGRAYEYRISAVVYNPLFAKSLSLPESQRELASKVSLTSLPGEWSAPYRVRRPTRAYVLRATASGQGRGIAGPLGLGIAQVEVYRFYDGQWHRSKQTLQPGDEVGVTEESADGSTMDYATGWYVIDIIADPLASSEYADSGRGAIVLLGQEGVVGLAETHTPLADRAAIKPWVEDEPAEGEADG